MLSKKHLYAVRCGDSQIRETSKIKKKGSELTNQHINFPEYRKNKVRKIQDIYENKQFMLFLFFKLYTCTTYCRKMQKR